ncbi:hypothetical protein JMJ35_003554 [Cladonia borealis]|uniref:Peptidase A1 domain-containing protein n=1 Tax=Cladonia borealis TaxID=184061 RepID=A0AA39R2Q5_9LECA|nr:hypothetical protein JMJ35_003554 [Cladonia borealis]
MIALIASYSILLFQLYIRRSYGFTILPELGSTDPNAFWTTEVTIGTQKLNLTVDTGSADLWVYSTDVFYLPGTAPSLHSNYTCHPGPTSNCTYEGFFSVHYGGSACATVSGNVTYDKVNISGTIVPEMGVEVAYAAGCFPDSVADGILGLSFGENNRAFPRQPTFMERLMPEPVFGIEFYKSTSGDHLANLNFGYVNETKARDGLVTASIGKNTIWMVDNVSFIIGELIDGVPVPVASGSKTPLTQDMIFDTGAGSQFAVDPRITLAYYAQVDGAVPTDVNKTSYKFPCNATLPDVYLAFQNGEAFGFRGQALTFNNPDPGDSPLSSVGVKEQAVGGVGAMFFESTYVVFNMSTEPSISFSVWNATAEDYGL